MTEPIEIRRIGPEGAAALHSVIAAAFGARPPLDPPADADSETVETVAAALEEYGGLVATSDGVPVAGLIFDRVADRVFLRRFGVVPAAQRSGIASRLVEEAVATATTIGLGEDGRDPLAAVAVVARAELPHSVRFWTRNGFRQVAGEPPYLQLERVVRLVLDTPDAASMRAFGGRLATVLRPGDLVVLTGELGAGKTTLTQGLGAGLGVRGDVTSPTFVIARVHPPLGDGPALVHADAYRLGGVAELDDLDLDTSLDDAVTVVEWGEGIAEGLASSRLDVRITRATGTTPPGIDGADPRRVVVVPIGARWRETDWSALG